MLPPHLSECPVSGDLETMMAETEGGTMCLVCHKVLAYKHDAKRHIRLKHGPSGKTVACEHCGKELKHHWALGDHMRKVHGHYSKKTVGQSEPLYWLIYSRYRLCWIISRRWGFSDSLHWVQENIYKQAKCEKACSIAPQWDRRMLLLNLQCVLDQHQNIQRPHARKTQHIQKRQIQCAPVKHHLWSPDWNVEIKVLEFNLAFVLNNSPCSSGIVFPGGTGRVFGSQYSRAKWGASQMCPLWLLLPEEE